MQQQNNMACGGVRTLQFVLLFLVFCSSFASDKEGVFPNNNFRQVLWVIQNQVVVIGEPAILRFMSLDDNSKFDNLKVSLSLEEGADGRSCGELLTLPLKPHLHYRNSPNVWHVRLKSFHTAKLHKGKALLCFSSDGKHWTHFGNELSINLKPR